MLTFQSLICTIYIYTGVYVNLNKSVLDTHVKCSTICHCKTRRQIITTINRNMQHCSIKLQKEVKSKVAAKNGCDSKLKEKILITTIQVNLVPNHSETWRGNTNSAELSLLKFLLLAYHHSHSWPPPPWISLFFSQWPSWGPHTFFYSWAVFELDRAIMRSHYPLPTIVQVTACLNKAKVFTVLDAKTGFWQVKLDQQSSYLTTFNMQYRWLRMPFGISSALEV